MAACSYTDLLADGKCFLALPPHVLRAATAQLWCNVAEAIGPVPAAGGGLFNPEAGSTITNPESGTPLANPES